MTSIELKQARKKLCKTQVEFANIIGCSLRTYRKFETGEVNISDIKCKFFQWIIYRLEARNG
jgi:DNA-binding XRE family transcriptional regulator